MGQVRRYPTRPASSIRTLTGARRRLRPRPLGHVRASAELDLGARALAPAAGMAATARARRDRWDESEGATAFRQDERDQLASCVSGHRQRTTSADAPIQTTA